MKSILNLIKSIFKHKHVEQMTEVKTNVIQESGKRAPLRAYRMDK